MKSPKNFREDVDFPLVHRSEDGKHETYASRNVEHKETRDWINVLLLQAIAGEFSNPYPVWQRVEKVLATYGIVMPRAYFPDVTGGELIFGVLPHGQLHDYNKSMPTELGDDVPNYFLYFEYGLSEVGTYVCFAEICDLDGLEGLTEDVENFEEILDEGLKEEKVADHEERLVIGHDGTKGFQRVFENKAHQDKELGPHVTIHSIQKIHEELVEESTPKDYASVLKDHGYKHLGTQKVDGRDIHDWEKGHHGISVVSMKDGKNHGWNHYHDGKKQGDGFGSHSLSKHLGEDQLVSNER